MYLTKGSAGSGTPWHMLMLAGLALTGGPQTFAETLFTVNDVPVDSEVLDIYMQSRVQKPLDQVTTEERMALTDELTDLYVLSTGDMATAMEKDPDVSAQLTLSRMGILARAVATSMAADIEVSEEEIQSAYEEQITMAPTVQYNARHILVESQGQAVEIIAALDNGDDFVELAKERSTGPSAPNGGDLGWFTSDQMVAPFSEAVAKLEDGKYTSTPVQTQFGWHVIKREGSRPAEPPPLEGVRETIVTQLQQQKLRARIDAMREGVVE